MQTARRILWSALVNAIFFAVVGFLLNLLPLLQTRPVNTWRDAGAVLMNGAATGVMFGFIWYFFESVFTGKRRDQDKL